MSAVRAVHALARPGRLTQASKLFARNASANTKAVPELDNPRPVASGSQPRAQSSVPAGTPLKGLGYLKDRPEPIALPDEEYPSWLWKLLDTKAQSTSRKQGFQAMATVKGEQVPLDKKTLRQKSKESIRASNFLRAQ